MQNYFDKQVLGLLALAVDNDICWISVQQPSNCVFGTEWLNITYICYIPYILAFKSKKFRTNFTTANQVVDLYEGRHLVNNFSSAAYASRWLIVRSNSRLVDCISQLLKTWVISDNIC